MQYMHCPETTSESSLQKNLVYAYNKVKNSNNSTYILVCTFQKKNNSSKIDVIVYFTNQEKS